MPEVPGPHACPPLDLGVTGRAIRAVEGAFHDPIDVSQWLLYANPAIYAGRGQVQGRVFRLEGGLVASCSVHAMIRGFGSRAESRVGGAATR